MLVIFVLLIGFIYICVIRYFSVHFLRYPTISYPPDLKPSTKISVIVPARNEAVNIQNCLASISQQHYPAMLFEVIVVNDFSDDDTVPIIEAFIKKNANVKLLHSKDFIGTSDLTKKKLALHIGIQNASGDIIVTTDADCIVPPEWLRNIVLYFEQRGVVCIAAPVNFYNEKNIFEKFQSLDMLGMMGVTCAGIATQKIFICNGANFAFTKKAFDAVGGYQGTGHIASGDDMFLMHKLAKCFPQQIGFLKSPQATVKTLAQPTFADFWQQRMRWASKSNQFKDLPMLFLTFNVLLICLAIVVFFVAGFLYPIYWKLFLYLFLCKSIADYFSLLSICNFFKRNELMQNIFPAQLLHIVYISSIGVWANLKKEYKWKGRISK
ncbi:MAG: glycosyltransferase [Saprospiraceae bacterium]|nr:glycosyltransferase [Saprospiraceae bacterium]